ncbi:MAG: DNA alkylation repair protein [bacterium]
MNADQIIALLETKANPTYRENVVKLIPQLPQQGGGAWTIIGVPTGDLRGLLKVILREVGGERGYRETLELAEAAFQRRTIELVSVSYAALNKVKRFWQPDLLQHIRNWIPKIADWAVCDGTGFLLGEMLLRGMITYPDIEDLQQHESLWGRRLSIVALVLPMRQGFGDVDYYLKAITCFCDSREKMIYKAVSWVLREGTKSNPDKIRSFLDQHRQTLHGSVLREVNNKLTKGTKK